MAHQGDSLHASGDLGNLGMHEDAGSQREGKQGQKGPRWTPRQLEWPKASETPRGCAAAQVKSMNPGARLHGFKSLLCHIPTTSLCLSFLTSDVGTMTASTSLQHERRNRVPLCQLPRSAMEHGKRLCACSDFWPDQWCCGSRCWEPGQVNLRGQHFL